MKKLITISIAALLLGGCASIPTGQKTTTIDKVDKAGNLVSTTTILETNVSPDAISQAASDMVQACYDSFTAEYEIKETYINKLDSGDLKDLLIFREFRVGLQSANGYNPRDVCKNPETVYTYAKAHDKELFATIRGISSDVTGAATSMTPFISLWKLGEAGINKAGDVFGDNGKKVEAGRDGQLADGDAEFSGTGDSKDKNENHITGSPESTVNAERKAGSDGDSGAKGNDGGVVDANGMECNGSGWGVYNGECMSDASAAERGLIANQEVEE